MQVFCLINYKLTYKTPEAVFIVVPTLKKVFLCAKWFVEKT